MNSYHESTSKLRKEWRDTILATWSDWEDQERGNVYHWIVTVIEGALWMKSDVALEAIEDILHQSPLTSLTPWQTQKVKLRIALAKAQMRIQSLGREIRGEIRWQAQKTKKCLTTTFPSFVDHLIRSSVRLFNSLIHPSPKNIESVKREYVYIPDPPSTLPRCPHCGVTSEGAAIKKFERLYRKRGNLWSETPKITVVCWNCGRKFVVKGPPIVWRAIG